MGKFLNPKERQELKELHRYERERRYADRIKALLLWDAGWTLEQIAEVLLLDEKSVRRFRKLYEEEGSDGLLDDDWQGSQSRLTRNQELELRSYLTERVYGSTKEIALYVERAFGIKYTTRGMHHVLIRLGFVYKKTKAVPGKADGDKQEEFVDLYRRLKKEKSEEDPIYFVDGVHPQHNSKPANGWILKGKEKQIPTNTGRRRLNLNGALNAETHQVIVREDRTINAQSTISLFSQLAKRHPEAEKIYVILDNARYYRSKLVREYVQGSKLELLFLPAYAPNLNLIERLWKFFKTKVLANQYYESYLDFKKACMAFFRNSRRYKRELRSLLVDNFQIIRPEHSLCF